MDKVHNTVVMHDVKLRMERQVQLLKLLVEITELLRAGDTEDYQYVQHWYTTIDVEGHLS
jgi:hypothetical protein